MAKVRRPSRRAAARIAQKQINRTKKKKMTKAMAERLINRALRAKGKGSVTRVWSMARSAAANRNIGVASELGHIARKKARFAYKMKNSLISRAAHSVGL